jgi:hypothetical protein
LLIQMATGRYVLSLVGRTLRQWLLQRQPVQGAGLRGLPDIFASVF